MISRFLASTLNKNGFQVAISRGEHDLVVDMPECGVWVLAESRVGRPGGRFGVVLPVN